MADVGDDIDADEYLEIANMTFATEDEGFQYYNKYVLRKGFSVRREYVEWDGANEEIILRKLVCCRQCYRAEKHMKRKRDERKRRPRNLTRCGCKAKLVIARHEETGRWFVKDFIDEHTHTMAPPDLACLMRSHR